MNTLCHFVGLKITLVLTVCIFSSMATADEMYKWVDKQGNVTYQSSPPPGSAVDIEKSPLVLTQEEDDVAETNEEKVSKLILYSKPDCEDCDAARSYFEEADVVFEEINLADDEETAKELDKAVGFSTRPVVEVGGRYITGFNKKMMSQILKNEGYDVPEIEEEQPEKVEQE